MSINFAGLEEVLSYGETNSLALCILSPAARYAAEQRPDGFRVPRLQIIQEKAPAQ